MALQGPLGKITRGQANIQDVVWTVHGLPGGEELLSIRNWGMADHANDIDRAGRLVVLGAEQGYVELWDVDAKAQLFRWQPHGGRPVTHLAIGPDGDIATVAEEEDRLFVLRLADVRAKLAELGLGW